MGLGNDRTDCQIGCNSRDYALNGKVMLGSIVIVFSALIGILCFHTCIRRRSRRRQTRQLNSTTDSTPETAAADNNSQGGLDPSVLKSLPTFNYAHTDKNRASPLECAVCLSEFEENESGRILPKCNHSFHIQCIDMWFQSHSSCPLCRAPVRPDVSVSVSISISTNETPVETAPSVGTPTQAGSMDTEPGSATVQPELENERMPLELVGISVEVPPMNERFTVAEDEMGFGSLRAHVWKSSGRGKLKLKRIWSI